MSALSAREVTLRKVLIATFLPALGFLVASGIVIKKSWSWWHRTPPYSFIALIPVGLSAITSSIILFINRKQSAVRGDGEVDSRVRLFRKGMLLADVVLTTVYFFVLMAMWVVDLGRIEDQGRLALVLGYGTVPVVFNWLIHLYFSTVGLIEYPRKYFSKRFIVAANGCPNCQHCRQREAARASVDSARGKEGYSLLRAEEYDDDHAESSTEPRISADA